MKVLVVGNIFKDVYLNIDSRAENFETDENGTKWLDLKFDASEHRFFSRTSNFGGAVISLEVLHNFGVEARLSGSKINFTDDGIDTGGNSVGDIYRYILVSDGQISYFAPSFEHKTTFEMPEDFVDCIYVDRSANLEDIEALADYLDYYPDASLVFHSRKNPRTKNERKLLEMASFIIAEHEIDPKFADKTVQIDGNKIIFGDESVEIDFTREDLMTHSTIYSIIGASILGGIIIDKDRTECLKLAKANVENSSLDSTLSIKALMELI